MESFAQLMMWVSRYLTTGKHFDGLTPIQQSTIRKKCKTHFVQDGVLWYNGTKDGRKTKVVTNEEERDDILYQNHAMSGHSGINVTMRRITLLYWWKGMKKDVVEYITSCQQCQNSGSKLTALLPQKSRSFLEDIQPILADAHYHQMKSALTDPNGTGPPPNLQPGPLTTKLVLQLEMLRTETKTSWEELESFLPRVLDGDHLQGLFLKSEIEAVVKQGRKTKAQGTDDAALYDDFLSEDLGRCISTRNIGPHLLMTGIFRQHLLKPEVLKQLECPPELGNGMIVDLIEFYKKENLHLSGSREFLHSFGADVIRLTTKQLCSRLHKIYKTYQSHKTNIDCPDGKEKMDAFLSARPDFYCRPLHEKSGWPLHEKSERADEKTSVQTAPKDAPNAAQSCINIKLSASVAQLADSRRTMEELNLTISQEREKNRELQGLLSSCNGDLRTLQEQMIARQQELISMQKEKQQLCGRLQRASLTIKTLRRNNNAHKRLQVQRKEKQLQVQRKETILRDHESGGCCEMKMRSLRRKIKLEQARVANLKKKMDIMTERSSVKVVELEELQTLPSIYKIIPPPKMST